MSTLPEGIVTFFFPNVEGSTRMAKELGDAMPYNIVDVLMEGRVHFQSQVLDCPPEEIYPDMPVEAVFQALDDEITLVKFRRV